MPLRDLPIHKRAVVGWAGQNPLQGQRSQLLLQEDTMAESTCERFSVCNLLCTATTLVHSCTAAVASLCETLGPHDALMYTHKTQQHKEHNC